ncbi:M20/M25/M40 family metallo-hydrolase [Myxococcota bacterium]|nr:M20/M25/M40 family metallo-hydrolase [Myxococcota bacterium]
MYSKMTEQFMEMVRIDSESGEEKAMMEYLLREVAELGGHGELDAYGNLIAKFPARGCEGKAPILLSCHADTVKPGKGIEPILDNGVIRSRGDTILGADDKAGIAEVLECVRTGTLYPPLEFVVSRQEEVGLHGVKNLDFSKVSAKIGFLMDNDTLETIVIGGPSYFTLDVTIYGKAAHAGMEPEKGINAIWAASNAISHLRVGRLDHQTTANVGIISGGIIRNGVPDKVTFMAECRSADHEKAEALSREMVEIIRREGSANGSRVEVEVANLCKAVSIAPDAPVVKIAQAGLATVGINAEPIFITGFTDASIYNNHGIEMAVVGIGAENEHSTDECISLDNMEKALLALREMLRICATR